MPHVLQEFLRGLGIVVDTTTVIQQASITRLTDSDSEQLHPAL
jgi:hypothetical protein